MQPLATTRLMMMWLSMCPADGSSKEQQRMAYVAHTWAVLFFNVINFVSSVAFCWKYFSIDFNGAMFAIMIAIGEFGLIYFMIVAILMCHQIQSIFTSLSTICKRSKFNLRNYFTRKMRSSHEKLNN